MLLIGLRPTASSLCWSQAGEGPTFTPRITLAVYLGQSSGSSTVTFTSTAFFPALYLTGGSFRGFLVRAATSRAIPITPRQSGRLEVTSISSTWSPSGVALIPATTKPAPVSTSASPSGGSLKSQYSFNQLYVIFMCRRGVLQYAPTLVCSRRL